MTHILFLNREPWEPGMQTLENQTAEQNQCGRITICKQNNLLCIFISQLLKILSHKRIFCITCNAHVQKRYCSLMLLLGVCLFWF